MFQRIVVVFAGVFGLVAMLLAAVGVYGVVAYTTGSARTRSASAWRWAQPSRSLPTSVLQGLRLALTGLAVGLLAISLQHVLCAECSTASDRRTASLC